MDMNKAEQVLEEARVVFSIMQEKTNQFNNVAKKLENIEKKLENFEFEISKKMSLISLKKRIEETNEILDELEINAQKQFQFLKKSKPKNFSIFIVIVTSSAASAALVTIFFVILSFQGLESFDFLLNIISKINF